MQLMLLSAQTDAAKATIEATRIVSGDPVSLPVKTDSSNEMIMAIVEMIKAGREPAISTIMQDYHLPMPIAKDAIDKAKAIMASAQ